MARETLVLRKEKELERAALEAARRADFFDHLEVLRAKADAQQVKAKEEQQFLVRVLGAEVAQAKIDMEAELNPEIKAAEEQSKLRDIMGYGIRQAAALEALHSTGWQVASSVARTPRTPQLISTEHLQFAGS